MIAYLAILALVAYLMFGVLLFARDTKKAPEVPPAEERPYIPQPSREALEKAAAMEKAIRDQYLREAFAARRQKRVQLEIDRLVREVGCA